MSVTPIVHVELLHDSAGADVDSSIVLDDVLRLHEAAEAAYGSTPLRFSMEGGDLGVRILARGADEATYFPLGAGMWRDAYGHSVRWTSVRRPGGEPVAIVWEVIG